MFGKPVATILLIEMEIVVIAWCEQGPPVGRVDAAIAGRTGVEMESMVGASVAALTVYDMTKALSKGIRIEEVELLEKDGGASGSWRRTPGA